MVKNFPPKTLVEALYEAGIRKSKAIARRVRGVSYSTIKRWVKKLNENESLERKTYPRARPKEYLALVYRVIEKVRDSTHPSLRAVERFLCSEMI